MFGLFRKDPCKTLQQQYQQKMEQAMQYQRNGNMMNYALLSAEAAELGSSCRRWTTRQANELRRCGAPDALMQSSRAQRRDPGRSGLRRPAASP